MLLSCLLICFVLADQPGAPRTQLNAGCQHATVRARTYVSQVVHKEVVNTMHNYVQRCY